MSSKKTKAKSKALKGEIVKPISIKKKQIDNLMRVKGITWYDIKKAYYEDDTLSYLDLATKFGIPRKRISRKAKYEKWNQTRQLIHQRAEEKMIVKLEDKLSAVKMRHSKIGKLLQKHGVEAIGKKTAQPKTAKDAVKFTIEGIRIEREAEGLGSKQKGGVVNIITQQQAIKDQYTIDGEEA